MGFGFFQHSNTPSLQIAEADPACADLPANIGRTFYISQQ
jgi:hypothetical protein